MRLKDFIRDDWGSFALYDNERSLPNIMDGLKTSQRKVIHTFIDVISKDKPIKTSQCGNRAAEYTNYGHGEVSIISAVVGLAQDFPGSNNYPLLQKHGQFGSRLSHKPAAARYTHVALHKNFHNFFKKEDQEVVIPQYEEGQKIEPRFFIPTVPVILLNGAQGVGNGYSSFILQYPLADVVRGLKEISKHGAVRTPLIPKPKGWNGNVTKVDKQVTFTGTLSIINTTTIHITELPPGYTTESYKVVLNKLVEDRVIKDYDNPSTEDNWHWVIDTYRATTALGEAKLIEMFKLRERTTETIVGWGVEGTMPITFESPEALLEYWYKERIKLYRLSIDKQIVVAEEEEKALEERMRFVLWCLANDFRNLTKQQFIDSVVQFVQVDVDRANVLVQMSMFRITTDEVVTLKKSIEVQQEKLASLHLLTPETILIDNLKELK